MPLNTCATVTTQNVAVVTHVIDDYNNILGHPSDKDVHNLIGIQLPKVQYYFFIIMKCF